MSYSIEEIARLSSLALTSPTAASEWIRARQIEFSDEVSKQAEVNRRRHATRNLSELYALPVTDDQIVTDYWMHHLDAVGSALHGSELAQVVDDVIELSLLFGSSYALSMLETRIGPLVRASPQRREIVRKLGEAKISSPEYLWEAWESFIAECRGE